MKIKKALLSVSDKSEIVSLARELESLGIELLSTGGTAAAIRDAGVAVTDVSDYTGFPEILEGRVKTLHPRIHAGILARLDSDDHRRTLRAHEIAPIGLVIVNLYPFEQTVADGQVRLADALEQIDIGGPTLLRAAAKNFPSVTVVVDPQDYSPVIAELKVRDCMTREETRQRLALKAFRHTAAYDLAIGGYLERLEEGEGKLPAGLALDLKQKSVLRYGENPHQRGALYVARRGSGGVSGARQHQGKQLSFNNYLDLDAAWKLALEFERPFCAIIKHNNPCGAAESDTLVEAYRKALACDPLSAFGSVIAFNRELDPETASEMTKLFVEAVLAPGYHSAAREELAAKKNLRVMEIDLGRRVSDPASDYDWKRISGGFLVQDRDLFSLESKDLETVTRQQPSPGQLNDLLFAWRVCKHVRSNAIVLAREGATLGIGAGQMSRVDSVRLAVEKASVDLAGAVMASDAFFPFRDGLDEAAAAGVKAVIQPGGSRRDPEVIEAADERGMAMVFTGIRHFRH